MRSERDLLPRRRGVATSALGTFERIEFYDHEARACGDLQMSEERIRGREVEDDIHVLGRGSEVRGHRPAVEVAAVARVARSLPEGAVADARGRLHRLQ